MPIHYRMKQDAYKKGNPRGRLALIPTILILMLLLVACGGSSSTQSPAKTTPTIQSEQGQQLLAKAGQRLNSAKTLHGILNTTIDGQAFNGTINTEIWNASPAKNRTVILQSSISQFSTGMLIVTDGKQVWQYDPSKKVVYTGKATSNSASGSTRNAAGSDQSLLILRLVQTVFTRSTATLVSSTATVDGQQAYDIHVVPQNQGKAAATPAAGADLGTGALDYEGEVYISTASQLPLKLDLSITGLGHVVVDIPKLVLNQILSDSLFTFVPPAGVKVLPLQTNSTSDSGSITLAQAQQQAGYHLLSIPSSQTGYQLVSVDALGSPGNQIYALNYTKGSIAFAISEGKALANLPADTGQQISIRGTSATLSSANGTTTLAWTEKGVGIRITGALSNADIQAIAKMLI